jgi:hypothetical protein
VIFTAYRRMAVCATLIVVGPPPRQRLNFAQIESGTMMKRFIWNKYTRLMLRHILGWLCILIGVIQGFIPFLQGWIFIAMGIFLLADHVPFFGKIRAWIHRRFPNLTQRVHDIAEGIRAKFSSKKLR